MLQMIIAFMVGVLVGMAAMGLLIMKAWGEDNEKQ